MELTKELKEKVEQAETKEEKTNEEVGEVLDDAELDQIAGGEPLFRLPLCQG